MNDNLKHGSRRFEKGARETYAAAAEVVEDASDVAREKLASLNLAEIAGKGRDFIRRHPGKTLLAGATIGFLLGSLFRNRRS